MTMQISLRRHSTFLSLALLVIGGGILLSLGLMRFYDIGVAHADTGNAVIAGSGSAAAGSAVATVASSGSATPAVTATDPLADPAKTLSTMSQLYHSGAWVPLVIFVAFGVLYVLVKEDSWFREGKRAVYFAAALGFLSLLAVPASQGTTPNLTMLVAALSAAIGLILPNFLPKKSS